MIENIFIINAPWIFATLWRLVKPFVAPRTIEKIKIFSANDEGERKRVRARRASGVGRRTVSSSVS